MLDILFVTDFVCPYCLVAKVALEEALKETGIEACIQVRKKHYQILAEPAGALGLDMKLPPAVCPRPYTRLAFEGFYFAREKGLEEVYSDLVYRAYFEQEQDIGELDTLCEIAGMAGLARDDFRQALMKGIYTGQVKEETARSRDVLKVGGVPAIYINGESVCVEKYTKEEMIQILRQGQASAGGGFACGVDGCG